MKKILVAWLCALAPLCHAARPMVADDARTVDAGGCQIESFYKEQRAYSGSEFWLLPACNRFDTELTIGGNRIEGKRNLVLQAKRLVKPLETGGYGLAFSVGSLGGDFYFNGISSVSFLEDRAVLHMNLGYFEDRPTWGVGLEQLLYGPRVYGILETFGERGQNPTLHGGIRYWVLLNRLQLDSTVGRQDSDAPRRFFTVGLRFLF